MQVLEKIDEYAEKGKEKEGYLQAMKICQEYIDNQTDPQEYSFPIKIEERGANERDKKENKKLVRFTSNLYRMK